MHNIHKNAQHIPQFALYGETDWVDDPGFIHSEDIASRSSPLGWVIQPHRHSQLYQCLIIQAGEANLCLDTDKHRCVGPCFVWIPPGVVHSFHFSQGTQGAVVSFSEWLLTNANTQQNRQQLLMNLSQPACSSQKRLSSDWKSLLGFQQQLQHELSRSALGKSIICEALVMAIIVIIARELTPKNQHTDALAPSQLFQRFKQLIDQEFKSHWAVEDFAKALNITPSRLNRLCKQFSQHSAKQLIQQRIAMESKRKLLYTRQTADEIAYDLGFKDPGYFSRFFKRVTGVTPGSFRKDNSL